MREHVFEPLGMTDTGFTVPAAKAGRLTTAYTPGTGTGELATLDDARTSWWSAPTTFPDASGWLVSTVDDYWSFVSMLLHGGTGVDGRRVLKPQSVRLMTTDLLTAAQRDASVMFLDEYGGWGLGLGVPANGELDRPLPCGIGWAGGTGTAWRSNLGSRVTGIALTQREVTSPEPSPLMESFWSEVNAAIETG